VATAVRTGAHDLPGLAATAVRLLERAVAELGEPDRRLARLAAERCSANLATCAERLAGAAAAPAADRDVLLRRAWQALAAARCDLDIVHGRGAMLPPGFRALVGGCEVVRRKIEDALAHTRA
jgi:hypothetical protein